MKRIATILTCIFLFAGISFGQLDIVKRNITATGDVIVRDTTVTNLIKKHSTTPVSGFLYWNATTKTFEPYASYTAGKMYLGTTNPYGSTRFNLDGVLFARNFTAFGTGTDVAGTFLAVNGYGLSVGTTGTGVTAVFEQGGSTGSGSSILSLKRTISGTGLAISNFIDIVDNPTTSGTISGKILSATIDTTERISLNPRATGTTVPYIIASHNKVTGNLFELKQQERTKLSLDSAGNVNIPAGASYKVNGVEIGGGGADSTLMLSKYQAKTSGLSVISKDNIDFTTNNKSYFYPSSKWKYTQTKISKRYGMNVMLGGDSRMAFIGEVGALLDQTVGVVSGTNNVDITEVKTGSVVVSSNDTSSVRNYGIHSVYTRFVSPASDSIIFNKKPTISKYRIYYYAGPGEGTWRVKFGTSSWINVNSLNTVDSLKYIDYVVTGSGKESFAPRNIKIEAITDTIYIYKIIYYNEWDKGINLQNVATGGSQTKFALTKMKFLKDFIKYEQPDQFHYFSGVNDVAYSTTESQTAVNIRRFCDTIKTVAPNLDIILYTNYANAGVSTAPYCNTALTYQTLNDSIKAICKRKDYSLLDINNLLGSRSVACQYNLWLDNIHLSNEGNRFASSFVSSSIYNSVYSTIYSNSDNFFKKDILLRQGLGKIGWYGYNTGVASSAWEQAKTVTHPIISSPNANQLSLELENVGGNGASLVFSNTYVGISEPTLVWNEVNNSKPTAGTKKLGLQGIFEPYKLKAVDTLQTDGLLLGSNLKYNSTTMRLTLGSPNNLRGTGSGYAVGFNALSSATYSGTGNYIFGPASAMTTGSRNVIMGLCGSTGEYLTTASDNVLIGNDIISFTPGNLSQSVVIGSKSARKISSVYNVVSIGYNSLGNGSNIGNDVVSIGSYRAFNNSNANKSTYLGSSISAIGSLFTQENVTMLGYNAGVKDTLDNRIYLANDSTSFPAFGAKTDTKQAGIFKFMKNAWKATFNIEGSIHATGAIYQDLLTGSLTDGAPTSVQINAITGLTPSTATAGYKRQILDSDGSGLIYDITSDGTSWQYLVRTKAL